MTDVGKTILIKNLPLEAHARYREMANAQGITMPQAMREVLILHAPRPARRVGKVAIIDATCIKCGKPAAWFAVSTQAKGPLVLSGPYCNECDEHQNPNPEES